jgi:hypothetical protein
MDGGGSWDDGRPIVYRKCRFGRLAAGGGEDQPPRSRLRLAVGAFDIDDMKLHLVDITLRIDDSKLHVDDFTLQIERLKLRPDEMKLRIEDSKLRLGDFMLQIDDSKRDSVDFTPPFCPRLLKRSPFINELESDVLAGEFRGAA